MPKLRVIIKPPPEPQGEPEQQVEALRDYLLQMSEELAYVLTHLEADNINDSTFERIQGMIPRPYTGLPVMDGDASSGQSEQWARGNHRHGHDSTKADVTALEETADDLAAHIADKGNPHEVTKAQVGLGNVVNERQYSALNPPPIPTPVQVGAIPTSEKGSAGGVAELDSNGMVPSAQLPSYVDDVLEYASLSEFPVSGESGKIYVALDTSRTYRWSGSAYVEISESLALGETSSTAYRGDRGKIAYDHSQTTGNPHRTTAAEVGARPDDWMPSAADVGLGNVENERQYSAQNPPPYPVTSVNGSTGTVSLAAADVGARPDNWVPDAEDVPYDNTQSGLMATDVQAAIDEIAQGGGGGGTAASAVSYDNTGSGIAATNVQDAIDEVYGDIPTQASDIGAQPTLTANGILKGDGQGGVSAATPGTDYASASDVASLDERYTNNVTWRMNTDANDYKTSGLYAMATGNANVPSPWGILFVQGAISDIIEQEYRYSGNIWNREFRNNAWSAWKSTTPTSESIGTGHTLIRYGKLRILTISFYVGTASVTIPVADRPTNATSGLAAYNDLNSAQMTFGSVTVNTDGSIAYQSWQSYNTNTPISNVTSRWVNCPGVIWMTA